MIKRYPINFIAAGLKTVLESFNTLIGLMLCVLVFASISVQATVPDFSDEVDAEIGSASGLDSLESSLQLWLDASNINADNNNGISSGDKVDIWTDLSGNGNNALQTDSDFRANYSADTITFDGSDDHFKIADTNELRIGQGADKEFTMVILYHATRIGHNADTVLAKRSRASSSATDYAYFLQDRGEKKIGFGTGPSTDSGAWLQKIQSNPINNTYLAFTTLEATGSQAGKKTFFINGASLFDPVEQTYENKGVSTSDELYIGIGFDSNSSNWWPYKGKIYEILIFNKALSDTERAKVTYYLSKKWGLESTMDSDGDGFTDAAEILESTDPLVPDADKDGTPDDADSFPNDVALQSNPTITANGLIKEIDRILGAHITIDGNTTTYPQLQTTENVKLWLDASQVHANFGNPAVDDEVRTWFDLSGNNHHAAVEDTGKDPQFVTDQGIGQSIHFHEYTSVGAETTGTAFRIPKFTNGLTKGEMYVVVRQDGAGNIDYRKGFHTWSVGRSIFVADTSNYLREGFGRNATTVTTDGSNFGMLRNSYGIYNVSVSENGKQIMRVQNVEKMSVDVTDIYWDEGTENFDMIGAASVLDQNDIRVQHQWRKGYMKEIIFFDTVLSDAERAAMHYYLANKWDTSDKDVLDSDGDGVVDASDYFPFDPTKHLADLSTEIDTVIGGGHNSESVIDDIEGDLLVWLDGNNIDNQKNASLSDSDKITQWSDLSGNNNHAHQDSSSNRPEFVSNINAVAFKGPHNSQSADRLIINDQSNLRIGQGAGKEFSIVILYNASKNSNIRTLISKTSGNQADKIDYAIFTQGNDKFYYATAGDSNSDAYNYTDAPALNSKHIAFTTLKATGNQSGANQLFIDGEKRIEKNYKLKGVSSDDPIYIGVRKVGFYTYIVNEYEGHIYEVLIFKKKLDEQERIKLTHYLAKKWGVTTTVDSDEDGFFDAEEITESTDPMDPNSIPTIDSDGDGVDDNVDVFPNDPSAAVDADADGYPDSIFSPYFTLQSGSGAGRALDYNPSNGSEYFWPSIVLTPSGPTFNTLDLAIQHITPNGIIYLADGNYGMTEGATKNVEIKRKSGATNVSITLNARVNP